MFVAFADTLLEDFVLGLGFAWAVSANEVACAPIKGASEIS